MFRNNLLKRECGYSAAADAKTASRLKRDREQTMLFLRSAVDGGWGQRLFNIMPGPAWVEADGVQGEGRPCVAVL